MHPYHGPCVHRRNLEPDELLRVRVTDRLRRDIISRYANVHDSFGVLPLGLIRLWLLSFLPLLLQRLQATVFQSTYMHTYDIAEINLEMRLRVRRWLKACSSE